MMLLILAGSVVAPFFSYLGGMLGQWNIDTLFDHYIAVQSFTLSGAYASSATSVTTTIAMDYSGMYQAEISWDMTCDDG
jgi:hypothetical protein